MTVFESWFPPKQIDETTGLGASRSVGKGVYIIILHKADLRADRYNLRRWEIKYPKTFDINILMIKSKGENAQS